MTKRKMTHNERVAKKKRRRNRRMRLRKSIKKT